MHIRWPFLIWISLFLAFIGYTIFIYGYCDKDKPSIPPNKEVLAGWDLWQKKNCQTCHQLYGLGGFMGPDLTNIASNPKKGTLYMKAMIQTGTNKMPNFHLSDKEVNDLIAYLSWVDKSGKSMVPDSAVNWMGNYELQQVK